MRGCDCGVYRGQGVTPEAREGQPVRGDTGGGVRRPRGLARVGFRTLIAPHRTGTARPGNFPRPREPVIPVTSPVPRGSHQSLRDEELEVNFRTT